MLPISLGPLGRTLWCGLFDREIEFDSLPFPSSFGERREPFPWSVGDSSGESPDGDQIDRLDRDDWQAIPQPRDDELRRCSDSIPCDDEK